MTLQTKNLVPDDDLEIYTLIYAIEVGLREFLIDTIAKDQPNNWRQRFPADILEKIREGREAERKQTWLDLIPHHPLYYIDFPDLRKILEKGDNWKNLFEQTFRSKDVFAGYLKAIEPVRNKIAHHRRTTEKDRINAFAVFHAISTAIGDPRFRTLISRRTVARNIPTLLRDLCNEAASAMHACTLTAFLPPLVVWDSVHRQWWFNAEYLTTTVESIEQFFGLLLAYAAQSRQRGTGHILQAWLDANDVGRAYCAAAAEFERISNIIREPSDEPGNSAKSI